VRAGRLPEALMTPEPGRSDRPESSLAHAVGEQTRASELADPDADLATFDRMVNRVAETFGVLILALLVGLVFVNAFSRYLLGRSFIWGDELIIAIIPWLAMSGLFLAVRRRQVIRIDYFVAKLPSGPRRAARLFSELLSALVLGYLAWVSLGYVQLFGADLTVYLKLPTGIFSVSFVIGPALAALAYLVTSWRDARGLP
jgi:TRAP-type C4-dicarboxylate transport system permease small subunit